MSRMIANCARLAVLVLVAGTFFGGRAIAQTCNSSTLGFPTCCLGDCNGNGSASAGELTKVIAVILDCGGVAAGCPAVSGGCINADKNHNGTISAGELTNIISNIINFAPSGCPPVTPSTPAASTPTNTATLAPNTPTNTPTNVPTNTPIPTATPSFTPTAGFACGGISVPASNCCNGVVDAGEQCDNGGTCIGGSSDMSHCTGNSGCPGGECRAFGGDGCAANCTPETSVEFEFTGAKCQGGAKNGTACTFIRTCIGGAFPTRPCSTVADCGPVGNQGKCTSECAVNGAGSPTNDGSDCLGVGACAAGTNAGVTCPSAVSSSVPPPPQMVCASTAPTPNIPCTCPTPGTPCTMPTPCGSGGQCTNPCPGSTCVSKSGATLVNLGGIIPFLNIGPLVGGETLDVGLADPTTGMIPVAVPAASVHFAPVSVPGLACACPHGVATAEVHGPGNSGSGFIGCGASGLAAVNVGLVQDHDTTPGNANNGPGTCKAGTRNGLACIFDTDCGTGVPSGTCANKGMGGGMCIGGSNNEKVCHSNADCPGTSAVCDSPDDATCTAQEPPPPEGSGSKACLEAQSICTTGPDQGMPCVSNLACGANQTCGTACNAQSLHPGVCNSPVHLLMNTAGGMGSGVIVTTTAIGTIQANPIGDVRPCRRAGVCAGFSFGATGATTVACEVDAQCTAAPKTCVSAYCAGLCGTGAKMGQPCLKNTDCGSGQVCTAGATYGQGCTGTVAGECGAANQCVAVDANKGFDGLPCTADDPVSSQGTAATLPTTTGLSFSAVVDVDNRAGNFMYDGICTGFPNGCPTSRSGSPFSCSALVNEHSVAGTSLTSTFDQIDGVMTGDTVVTNTLTAGP
jgi:hypothetical protein